MVSRRHLLKLSALGTASFAAPLAYSASNITMTHNTGNPIGSTSPKDLSDNTRNLDYLCLGPNHSYLDRKGVPRKSWKGMEEGFHADQAARENQFSTFLDSSGYEAPVAYAPGLTLCRVTQSVTYLGKDYRVKSEFIPLITMGWEVDESKMKLIGDDSLRQEVASAVGAVMIGTESPGGTHSTLGAEIQAIDKEYSRAAWSELMGNLQVGPLIVDAARHLRITGDLTDKPYNDVAYQTLLAGLPSGAEVEHPSRGLVYLDGGYNITATGVNLRGRNSGNSYDQFLIKFMNAAVPAFNVKNSGFAMSNLLLHGAITGRALNSAQDAFDFDVKANNGHIDCRIDSVGLLFFRACSAITKSAGRNVNFNNCTFSNSRHALSLEYAVVGPEDQRVFEFINCKYHSMGRLLSATDSVFYINPLAQALSLVVSGGHADETVRIMRGFAGMSQIGGLLSSRAAGVFADLDATGFAQNGYGQFNISASSLMNINTTTHKFSALKSRGPIQLHVDGLTIGGAGGHGLEIRSSGADIRGTTVHNASMGDTNLYSGFYVAPEASNVSFGGGCSYHHGQLPLGGTTAKYAVENLGTNTMFLDHLSADGLAAEKIYYIDPAKASRGPDPANPAALRRTSYGAAAPTTGLRTLGDLHVNISSSGANYGWRCTASGTPGTWIAI